MTTSVLTLPSHMTGFLHELGTQSGIYRSDTQMTFVYPVDSLYHSLHTDARGSKLLVTEMNIFLRIQCQYYIEDWSR